VDRSLPGPQSSVALVFGGYSVLPDEDGLLRYPFPFVSLACFPSRRSTSALHPLYIRCTLHIRSTSAVRSTSYENRPLYIRSTSTLHPLYIRSTSALHPLYFLCESALHPLYIRCETRPALSCIPFCSYRVYNDFWVSTSLESGQVFGANWTQLEDAEWEPRHSFATAQFQGTTDPKPVLYLAGGCGYSGCFDDVWKLEANSLRWGLVTGIGDRWGARGV
jgi:hypothetical protein